MTTPDNQSTRHNQHWFFCLPGPQWILYCGITSLVIGILWMLEVAGVFYEDVWDFALPILLIIWGAAYVIHHFRNVQRE